MHNARLAKAVSTVPAMGCNKELQEGFIWQLVTKFSDSSFTLETGGTVVTDSLEGLALNLSKEGSLQYSTNEGRCLEIYLNPSSAVSEGSTVVEREPLVLLPSSSLLEGPSVSMSPAPTASS